MKALLLVAALLGAEPVIAPADAPVRVMDVGETVLERGLFMPEAYAIAHAKHEVELKAKLQVYEEAEAKHLKPAVVVAIVVAAVVAGGFAGWGISEATRAK